MNKKSPNKSPGLSIDDEEHLFHSAQTVAMVGLSDKSDRESYRVAEYLIKHGFIVFPVNPNIKNVLGLKAYAQLSEIPDEVDIVDIFCQSAGVDPIVDEAIRIKAKVIWMQEGVDNKKAAQRAKEAGLLVEIDKCLMKEHQKYKYNS